LLRIPQQGLAEAVIKRLTKWKNRKNNSSWVE
jgi:hypothetical protein